ncbi:hypothetical protein DI273_20655 [Streptomyces violascens]|nr:hypothetical protein DI273_20655 [Streptomyces violascens]
MGIQGPGAGMSARPRAGPRRPPRGGCGSCPLGAQDEEDRWPRRPSGRWHCWPSRAAGSMRRPDRG